MTIGSLLLSLAFACYLLESTANAFNVAISLSGGLCGSTVIFIFPGVMSTLISHRVAEKASAKYHSTEDLDKVADDNLQSNKESFLNDDDVFYWTGIVVAGFGTLLFISTLYIHVF